MCDFSEVPNSKDYFGPKKIHGSTLWVLPNIKSNWDNHFLLVNFNSLWEFKRGCRAGKGGFKSYQIMIDFFQLHSWQHCVRSLSHFVCLLPCEKGRNLVEVEGEGRGGGEEGVQPECKSHVWMCRCGKR